MKLAHQAVNKIEKDTYGGKDYCILEGKETGKQISEYSHLKSSQELDNDEELFPNVTQVKFQ